ncbi:type II toxin-antitoxin system VapC family toxin [Methylobacterium terricola]|uniref:Ribonuclease VapC n=1 Tax=Methylobacterium terricola TaxID=2583531 RepID=A0A5C4LFH1_9HYPH|nr:type II toxin-antitoxin system VapC family toxin [Methylobacterium terricola]TNC11736.1 type II toxin-antitoxin system VapC family toxin [Methylobacterium terricola]
MIALDTSALVAIALDEPESETFSRITAASGAAVMGMPTLVETHMVLESRMPGGAQNFIDGLLRIPSIQPIDFARRMFRTATEAFDRFGRGRGHPARLNMGDCMAYAVARTQDLPLLFKGNDFVHTALIPAAP